VHNDMRSGCPVNLSLEIFGDRWTLLVVRDIIFGGARHYRELLNGPERISSNILADRLATLVGRGLLTKADDPSHKQKITYSLTEEAIELVPVLAQLIAWGMRHLPVADEYAARGEVLVAGGPPLWEAFMDELRETHLGPAARRQPPPTGPTVTAQLQAAYESALPHQPTHRQRQLGDKHKPHRRNEESHENRQPRQPARAPAARRGRP
jgi:DNA-binding HxlR family transcriptional regulator